MILIKYATLGGDLNKMEIFEIFELGIYLVVLIDLLISILIMNSQSVKVINLKKIMKKFYGFFEFAFQGVKKCGVFMQNFHLLLNGLYDRFPKCIEKCGAFMQNFHLLLNVFYDRFPKCIKKCGVFMKKSHLWLDSFYHRIPEGVKNSGNVIRKFHTGKINTNLLYFVVSIFLSMILIILVN